MLPMLEHLYKDYRFHNQALIVVIIRHFETACKTVTSDIIKGEILFRILCACISKTIGCFPSYKS